MGLQRIYCDGSRLGSRIKFSVRHFVFDKGEFVLGLL